jgi:hypothetical protein
MNKDEQAGGKMKDDLEISFRILWPALWRAAASARSAKALKPGELARLNPNIITKPQGQRGR